MTRKLLMVACVLVGITAFLLRSRAAAPALSKDALDETFDSGISRLVIAWDQDDARPHAARRAALFDFMYETYQSSAWVPQSLFDTNAVTQAVVGDMDTIVGREVGLVRWRDNPRVPAFGMAPNVTTKDPSVAPKTLRWTVNCLVCHTAEIDGVAYFGAGSKTFDELWLGTALKRLTSEPWLSRLRSNPDDFAFAKEANRILNSHHHDKIDSLTRARSTAFAASHVEMFMRSHEGRMPDVAEVGRGDVKTPPLWHTVAKMPVGRWYSDGSFHGPFPLMASSMELEKDRSFETLSTAVVPVIKDEFTSVIQHLRAPRYPYAIDVVLAEKGRALFNSREMGCASCHGTYDGRGGVDWPGRHVDVGTDRGRLDVVTPQFVDAFEHSPLAAEGALKKSRGYAATPLTGVWANFPYLHNGSVPTLYDLLGPATARPKVFEVMAARTLDRERVGQPLGRAPKDADDRNWFNTARPSCGNGGHDFWSAIKTDANRRALIEYLKTL